MSTRVHRCLARIIAQPVFMISITVALPAFLLATLIMMKISFEFSICENVMVDFISVDLGNKAFNETDRYLFWALSLMDQLSDLNQGGVSMWYRAF